MILSSAKLCPQFLLNLKRQFGFFLEKNSENKIIKGRGAQVNPNNRFFKNENVKEHIEGIDEDDFQENIPSSYIEVFPKTIINKVSSPDIGPAYSLNPYQGCEHGCIYCYARNSHEYWGYSAGLDFETKILVKKNAVELVNKQLSSKNWKPQMVMLSGNTDCYQPIEKKLKITREILKMFLKHGHPVGVITKNALILRDIDLLKELNHLNLLRVSITLTSLDDKLRQVLEPRTATYKRRMETIETLSANGIPVNVMMAPIIPGLNNHEILPLVKKVAELGAYSVNYTIVRLNGQIANVFVDWVKKNFPDRANKILHQIEFMHNGKLNDSRYGVRMRGEGKFAEQVSSLFKIARHKYLKNESPLPLDFSLFHQLKKPQLNLFSE